MTSAQACAAQRGAVPSEGSMRPLCRRYVLGLFDIAIMRWRDAEGLRGHPVHWAFGWLADGECESLGVWIESGMESETPLGLLADLKSRGLERIRNVIGTETGRLRSRVADAFASTGHRSPSSEPAAENVRDALARAIRRRGSFASEAEALDFISGALQRTEHRLDRERAIAKVRPRHESGAQMVPPGV